MSIINVEEIDKIYHNNYNDTEKSLFYSEMVEIEQLYLENNFPDNIKDKIRELNKNKYTNLISNGRYFIILNDNYAYFYMIFDNNSIIKGKKIELKLLEETNLLEQNIGNINKNIYYNFSKCYNEKKIEESFDNESTNLSYFSTTQLNPLFSFHTLNKGYKNIVNENDNSFYENICNDLEYTNLNIKDVNRVENTPNDSKKSNKIDNENIEEKIKEAMSKKIISS